MKNLRGSDDKIGKDLDKTNKEETFEHKTNDKTLEKI